MTTRTFALLLLFVLALGLSAVLVAAIQPMAVRFDASTPWVVPLAAIVCYSATFFAGRHYILPFAVSHSAVRALATLVAVTVVSMGLAYGLVRHTHGRRRRPRSRGAPHLVRRSLVSSRSGTLDLGTHQAASFLTVSTPPRSARFFQEGRCMWTC
jgi:hypothetical protein